MTTPSTDISKYDLTDEQSATSPAYVAGLFGALMASRGDGKLPHIYEYKTPGTYSVTVPEGVNAILVLGACGAGGGGANAFPASTDHSSGAGGGGGAAITNKCYPVTPGAILSISVGLGGGPGVPASSGSATALRMADVNIFSLNGGGGARMHWYTTSKPLTGGSAGGDGGCAGQSSLSTGAVGGLGGGNLLIGGNYPVTDGSTPPHGTYGQGGCGGSIYGPTYVTSGSKGGGGYLCFMFVNYDFDMSRGGGV